MTIEAKILTDEQIDVAQEAAYRALVEKGYNGGMGGYQWDRASARAIEQAILQSPEVQAWKKDAERYRWLRDIDMENSRVIEDMLEACLSDDDLDASIDAAMEKQP